MINCRVYLGWKEYDNDFSRRSILSDAEPSCSEFSTLGQIVSIASSYDLGRDEDVVARALRKLGFKLVVYTCGPAEIREYTAEELGSDYMRVHDLTEDDMRMATELGPITRIEMEGFSKKLRADGLKEAPPDMMYGEQAAD